MSLICRLPACENKAHPNSDTCRDHINLRKLNKLAQLTGMTLVKDGQPLNPEVTNAPKRASRPGQNHRSIGELRNWIGRIDKEAPPRFQVQLVAAETLALELDRGNTANAGVYRGLVGDIYARVDRLYGTKTLDTVTILERRITDNEIVRLTKGWG